mmetsp:Transcript_23741/g.58184  ORF Transcript_23741/g.58184 Transcript_23741/m.58184 type:complete len:258 (+) Transcript_23741:563-1336(+)
MLSLQAPPTPPRPYCCLSSGKAMTSRMDAEFVSSITSRSTPNPMPAVGGMPYSSAVTKSSSMSMGYSSASYSASAALPLASAAARRAACVTLCVSIWDCSRRRCSTGSVSSLKLLASSRPTMNSSKRSVTPGLERCGLASGEISVGWSSTKVGCRSLPSTVASNISFSTCPTDGAVCTPVMAFITSLSPVALSQSRAADLAPSTSALGPQVPMMSSPPVASATRSFMGARRHGRAPRSMVSSPYGMTRLPPLARSQQ